MASTFATLACYFLALSFHVALALKVNSTVTATITTAILNQTYTTAIITPTNSTAHVTAFLNTTENTTPFTSTASNNETSTAGTALTTGLTSQVETSTTITTALTNSSEATTTPGTHTPTFTALTTPANETTAGDTSTLDTTVITTANSSQSVNTTTPASVNTTMQGVGLNMSDVNMTIIFSVVLGVFAVALVVVIFHKCRHKIQYLHQPLNNTDDTGAFVADNDTLVISGGLYADHPIYDNVPTATDDQSQFRLEFLH